LIFSAEDGIVLNGTECPEWDKQAEREVIPGTSCLFAGMSLKICCLGKPYLSSVVEEHEITLFKKDEKNRTAFDRGCIY
jgi:hypothetical protein